MVKRTGIAVLVLAGVSVAWTILEFATNAYSIYTIVSLIVALIALLYTSLTIGQYRPQEVIDEEEILETIERQQEVLPQTSPWIKLLAVFGLFACAILIISVFMFVIQTLNGLYDFGPIEWLIIVILYGLFPFLFGRYILKTFNPF